MNKWDCYPGVIKSNQVEQANPKMDAVTFLKQETRMCGYGCEQCPIEQEIGDDIIDCMRWIEKNPDKAVELVSQWAAAHPETITWNEWLHTMHSHYSGLTMSSFIEWLNTPIPEDAKKKFNISESF